MFYRGFSFEFECTRSHKDLESCRTNIWSKWFHAIHENISHCINCMWVDDVLKVSLAGAHLQANKMHVSAAILAEEPMAPATRINGIATVCLQRKIMPLHKVVTSCSQCLTNVHAFMIWNTCRIASRTYPIKCKSNRGMDKWWTHFHMIQSWPFFPAALVCHDYGYVSDVYLSPMWWTISYHNMFDWKSCE